MRRVRLFWQIYPAFLVVILLIFAAIGLISTRDLRRFHYSQRAADLGARARLLQGQFALLDPGLEGARIDSLCKVLGAATATRVTIVHPSGRVLGDSERNPAEMDNHALRPEIAAALTGGTGMSTRYSHTLQTEMMYLAIPVTANGQIVAVVRTALPTRDIDRTLKRIGARMALVGGAIAVFAALMSLGFARRLTRPIERMRRAAARYARGEFDYRIPVAGPEEIVGLADAMNGMASDLSARLEELESRHDEQAALLSGMVEGVIAVDPDEHVIGLNRAAADLLSVDLENVKGRPLLEATRSVGLLRFVRRALETDETEFDEIVLRHDGERILEARGTVLRDRAGTGLGAIIVLSDVTRLRRLENVRRDFVANVSHELRTPITSIKGFVETLRDGAISDPEDAGRFLDIILKQADRLNAIIEDLLSLSRIEQERERAEISFEERDVRPILQAALSSCGPRATEREIHLNLSCEEGIVASLNGPLIEEAVVNLVDNAIKYSDPGGRVDVEAARIGPALEIRVRDEGCGIPKEHLPRLFERFYTVDKARSRRLGGTGLGLAIVKHIAYAHGGEVHVESTPGKGSAFTIRLPLRGGASYTET